MTNQERPRFIIYHNEKELLTVKGDLYLLHRHLDFVKEQIVKLQKKIDDLEQEVENKKANQLIDDVDQMMYERDLLSNRLWFENGFHRMIINPFIVSTWSVFESVLKDFADLLIEAKGVELTNKDMKRGHFFKRIERLYRIHLDNPLRISDDQKKELQLLSILRNAIVHNYGSLTGLPENLQKEIRSGKSEDIRLDEHTNKFILNINIAESFFETVRSSLLSLLNEYQQIS